MTIMFIPSQCQVIKLDLSCWFFTVSAFNWVKKIQAWAFKEVGGGGGTLVDLHWLEDQMCKQLHLHALFGCSVYICTNYKRSTFFSLSLWICAPLCATHAGSLFISEEQKLAGDVCDTFATHVSPVYITDTDCWAKNGSTHSHVLLKHWFWTNRAKNWVFFIYFLSCCSYIFFPILLIQPLIQIPYSYFKWTFSPLWLACFCYVVHSLTEIAV